MAVKIAAASSDGIHIDRHFGQTEEFRIYEIQSDGSYQETATAIIPVDSPCATGEVQEGHGEACDDCGIDDESVRIRKVIEILDGVQYLLVEKIGRKPILQLSQAGITALEAPADLNKALSRVHRYLTQTKGKPQ